MQFGLRAEGGVRGMGIRQKDPKMHIRRVKVLLENPKNLFEIPDSARLPRTHGIGALQPGQEDLGL